MRIFLLTMIFAAALTCHGAEIDSPDALKFHAAENGGFKFDTGILRGTLRAGGKSEGLSSVVHVASGKTLDRSKGLFSLYRVFSANKRFGEGAWDWPSSARLLNDGSVEVHWAETPEHPFDLRADYRWSGQGTLDLTTTIKAGNALNGFEVFLASYFNSSFSNSLVLVKIGDADGKENFSRALSEFGRWQMFPRDNAAVTLIRDGRWKIPPSPVDWAIRPFLVAPVGVRHDPDNGLCGVVMASKKDCFALSTPHETEPHGSIYLSLFGRDLKRGEEATARARLVIASKVNEKEIMDIYRLFISMESSTRIAR